MLSLDDLLQFAGQKKIPLEKRRGIVREYLQILLLYYLQKTKYAPKMLFIGGTALRFFYNLQRFSEDLDFNYKGNVNKKTLHELAEYLIKELKKENIEMRFSIRRSKEAYFHWKVYLQFPDILQYYGCAGRIAPTLHPLETISIQLDFHNLGRKKYPTAKKVIANFDKRFIFNTTTLSMFLAEKSHAILARKAPMGRDFFDLMSLLEWGANLNLQDMRKKKITVKNKKEYEEKIKNRIDKLDFAKLTSQLAPFLFSKEDIEIMKRFKEHWKEVGGW